MSGISIAYLSDLERGKLANPTLDTLTALAGALDVSLNVLLGLQGDEPTKTRLPAALEEFRKTEAFRSAIAAESARRRVTEAELESGWLESLAGIRVARRIPRGAADYQFIFEAIRRVLD